MNLRISIFRAALNNGSAYFAAASRSADLTSSTAIWRKSGALSTAGVAMSATNESLIQSCHNEGSAGHNRRASDESCTNLLSARKKKRRICQGNGGDKKPLGTKHTYCDIEFAHDDPADSIGRGLGGEVQQHVSQGLGVQSRPLVPSMRHRQSNFAAAGNGELQTEASPISSYLDLSGMSSEELNLRVLKTRLIRYGQPRSEEGYQGRSHGC